MDTYNIFILTSEWEDDGDNHVIRFYGRSEDLGPVELVFDDTRPLFFVDREELLPALDVTMERKEVKLKSMGGRPVDALYFNTQKDLKLAADRFQATGVRHYEADVRPPDRFLMERFINGMAVVAGDYEQNGKLATFTNPKIKAGRSAPALSIASIDIETGVSSGQLYSIAGHITGRGEEVKKVFMLADRKEELPEQNLTYLPSEKSLLTAFLDWFAEEDPDIIIGWHVIGFDLMYLDRKCKDFGLELALARSKRSILLTERPGAGYFATISGRVVIDGPPSMRNNGYSFPNYKLETVAQAVLKTGKLIASDHNKVAEIDRQFREDKEALARYNLEDCVLVTDIYNKLNLIPMLIQRTRFSGMLLDQLGISNASFDHYYLPKLHRKGMVAPNPEVRDLTVSSSWDLEPTPGIYEHVAILGMAQMYPSLIRIFKIEPLAHRVSDVDTIQAPGGFRFSNSEHLLPHLLERLMLRCSEAQQSGDALVEKATTMQLQTICKVLHAKTCRFFDPELSRALQNVGQWFGRESKGFLESKGYKVIRTDEDAIFIELKPEEASTPEASAKALASGLESWWEERLKSEFGVDSHLDIRFLDYYKKFLQPEFKTGDDSKKRYAGFQSSLVMVGMERILSDWTELSRDFMEVLLGRLFRGEELETWLLEYVNRLKGGALDHQLVYQKRIKKDVADYAKNAPPHIRAARMLEKPGRQISYVWTKRGPVPEELEHADIDYEHYIQKQIQPVADAALTLLGKSFKSITEPEQISLF